MPVSRERLRWLVQPALIGANALAALALVAGRRTDLARKGLGQARHVARPRSGIPARHDRNRVDAAACRHCVAGAVPGALRNRRQRGDWIEQFGFIRSDGGGEPTTGLEAKRLGLLRLV